MTITEPRIALYLRQSKDSEGDELAVSRQRDNCIELVERHGWTVDPELVFVDNDVSASSAKPRPAYQRLVRDVQAGRVDTVVAWNLDRLTRRPREIEDWLDWHAQYGVNLLTSEDRDPIDLANESGRMMLRIKAAVARQEVERKGRRQRESNQQGRALGVPAGGRRAFGYTRLHSGARSVKATRTSTDGRAWLAYGHEPLEPEAGAVRRGYDLLIAGATLRSIAREWNEAGLTTTVGHQWEAYALRALFSNPRNAGLVAPPRMSAAATTGHNLGLGDLPSGTWEPLVSPETWAAACAILGDPGRLSSPGPARKHLLSGVAKCGLCGEGMKAGSTNGVTSYRCSASPHLARKRDDADRLVYARVVDVIATVGDEVLSDRDRPDLDALRRELAEVQAGQKQLASLIARGLMSSSASETAAVDVRKRIGALESQLMDAGRAEVLVPLVKAANAAKTDDARHAAVDAVWRSLDVDRRREVVRAMFEVTMTSPGKGSRPPSDAAGRMAHTAKSVALKPRWATS